MAALEVTAWGHNQAGASFYLLGGVTGFDRNALERAFNQHNERPHFSLFGLPWLANPPVRVAAAAPVAVAEGGIGSVPAWRA